MKHQEILEEEVDFWLGYISKWEVRHNEPIPDRAQQLLNNAVLKLEGHDPGNNQAQTFQGSQHTTH